MKMQSRLRGDKEREITGRQRKANNERNVILGYFSSKIFGVKKSRKLIRAGLAGGLLG
jgi:hypothetical protein